MGGWHKGVTPPRTQKGMFGAGDGRAQRWLLMDHHVMPSDKDAYGDKYPQFGDPHLPGGHRDRLRGPSHPGDIPALPRSPGVHRMAMSMSLGMSLIHGP